MLGLKIAAYSVCGIVAYYLVLNNVNPSDTSWQGALVFLVLFVLGMYLSWLDKSKITNINYIGLGLMGFSLFGLSWVQANPVHLILLVVFSGIIPYFLRLSWSLTLIAFVFIVAVSLLQARWAYPNSNLFYGNVLSYLTFSAFALFTSYAVQRESKSREELASVNKQLIATQQLLTDNAVQDERLRISRDLHDTLGHHLTALNLQLEVARKITTGKSLEHVEQAQAIAKLLLSDVRDVVADMRAVPALNIHSALQQLAESTKAKVNLSIDPSLKITNPRVVETLFRLTQEIITNANRHSRADTLTIQINDDGDNCILEAADDLGQVVIVNEGSGIRGMRERVSRLGGEFILHAQQGIRYHISLPKHD